MDIKWSLQPAYLAMRQCKKQQELWWMYLENADPEFDPESHSYSVCPNTIILT